MAVWTSNALSGVLRVFMPVIANTRNKEVNVIRSDTCVHNSMLFRGGVHSLPLGFQKKCFTLGRDGLLRPSSALLHQLPSLSETSILLFPV